MYDFLDRPVASLAVADLKLLAAMRAWVHALTLAGEPIAAVTGRFADGGAAFDEAMRLLDRESIDTLTFQRPCHDAVEETEAVMLALWQEVRGGHRGSAVHTARLLVGGAAAPALIAAMRRLPAFA